MNEFSDFFPYISLFNNYNAGDVINGKCFKSIYISSWNHPLIWFATFSEKLTFLTPTFGIKG